MNVSQGLNYHFVAQTAHSYCLFGPTKRILLMPDSTFTVET